MERKHLISKSAAKTLGAFLLLSLVATLLSAFYQRASNEIVQWGTECPPEYWFHCFHPNISGGFPFAFLFDDPSTSVHNSLGFADRFDWLPFVVDVWFYFIALIFSYVAFRNYAKVTHPDTQTTTD